MKRIISRFSAKQSIGYAFLGRSTGGFSEKYAAKTVTAKNLTHLRQVFGTSRSTLMRVQAGTDVRVVRSADQTLICDGLITDKPNHSLLIKPADCIPLVLFSKTTPLLALVHGSRKSLDENIVQKTLTKMQNMSGKQPGDFAAYIGPGIGKASYILPAATIDALRHGGWRQTHAIRKISKDAYAVDLKGFIVHELRRLGLRAEDISTSTIDTATNDAYYSHYRSTRHNVPEGRNGFVVCILQK